MEYLVKGCNIFTVNNSERLGVLEGATTYIFSMPHLHHNDNKFFIFDAVDNSVRSLTYTILIVTG